MKKRILGTLLAAALVVTQAVSVFAAGSKTTQATPAGESVGKYEMIEGTEENFKEVAECTVPKVHHGNHDLPAKAYGLAGVFKEGHITPPISHIPYRSAEKRSLEQHFFALSNHSVAEILGILHSSTCCGEESLPNS